MKVKSLSRARLLATPWTATYQAPPSMGFSRQEYWSGVPLPSPFLTLTCSKTAFEVTLPFAAGVILVFSAHRSGKADYCGGEKIHN